MDSRWWSQSQLQAITTNNQVSDRKATGKQQPFAMVVRSSCVEDGNKKAAAMHKVAALGLLTGCVILAGTTHANAHGDSLNIAQIVALDECYPTTFN
jgi:hypothetical protein